jgi:hypothetical protein
LGLGAVFLLGVFLSLNKISQNISAEVIVTPAASFLLKFINASETSVTLEPIL